MYINANDMAKTWPEQYYKNMNLIRISDISKKCVDWDISLKEGYSDQRNVSLCLTHRTFLWIYLWQDIV